MELGFNGFREVIISIVKDTYIMVNIKIIKNKVME